MPNTLVQVQHQPHVYAYFDHGQEQLPWTGKRHGGHGRLKVGYTIKKVADRVKEIHGVKGPAGVSWTIVVDELAQRDDGQYFNDHAVHDYLEKKMGVHHLDGEWFECTKEEVLAAIPS